VLPLALDGARPRGLDGAERWRLDLPGGAAPGAPVLLRLTRGDGRVEEVAARLDLHSSAEVALLQGGGVLPAMMARLRAGKR